MRVSIYNIFITLLVGANVVYAGVVDTLERRDCRYHQSNALSKCMQGDTMFCTGNVHTCTNGETTMYDATVTSANQEVCKGKEASEPCLQTVMCCP